MALEFKLPDIGEGIAEGEIVQWLVKPGDTVEEHQAVVEVMTDKATVEVPAPAAGKITELKAEEGDVVPVGDVIFLLDTEGASGDQAGGDSGDASGSSGGDETAAAAPAGGGSNGAGTSGGTGTSGGSGTSGSSGGSNGAGGASGGGRTLEFKLPDIGEGIAEGEIVQWLVKAGDAVEEHQPVVEVMTDKATVEVPAPAAGTVTELKAEAGDVVPVGDVIFLLSTGAGGGAEQPAQTEPASASGSGAASNGTATHSAGGGSSNGSATAVANRPPGSKVLAVPSARRVARELDIDLAQVPGSGRNGVIRRADVEAFAQGGTAAPAAPQKQAAPSKAPAKERPEPVALPKREPVSLTPGERETRKPFRGVRRKIAEAMSRSMYTAPHFTIVEEVDVTELVRFRQVAKAYGAEQGIKVTFMPFIMKATAIALSKHPMLNAALDEETQEIVTYHTVDLGIATDTPNGLIVPVVRDVQAKGALQLAEELNDLAERTREGKVSREELSGSTFTITNAGNIGGTLATPIINFPEVAIMGVHRIMKRPGVVETSEGDRYETRQYMNFSCSVDHRLADGADGARFLVEVKRLLEEPALLSL